MSKPKLLGVLLALISLNVYSQSEFLVSKEAEIVDFPGPFYYVIEQHNDEFSFKEFDVDNQEQSEATLDISSLGDLENIRFHSMTRYGDSDKFLVVISRFLMAGATFQEADSVEQHYYRFDRQLQSFDLHIIDTMFARGMKLESFSDDQIYKVVLSGNNSGASNGSDESGELISVNDQLEFTQLAPADSIIQPITYIRTFRTFNDTVYFFNAFGPDVISYKYSSQGDYAGPNLIDVSNGISYTHVFGLRHFEDSIFMVLNGTIGDFNSGYQEVFRLFSMNYDFDELFHDIQLYQSADFELHDGQIDYKNRHVVILMKSVINLTSSPMKVMVFDFNGNIVCQSQIPYHHLNTEVSLESLNDIVYLKHSVSSVVDEWEPFTCDILNVESTVEDLTNRISFYPNPTNDILNIESSFSGDVEILDLQGRLIHKESIVSGISTINVTNLKPGNYIIQLSSQEGMIRERFVKL